MLIYLDRFTRDEIVSDSYKQEAPFGKEELSDVAFEIMAKRTKKGAEDYGISANVDEDAEEGATADGGAGGEEVVDLLDKFDLSEFPLSKKDFVSFIKKMMKHVKSDLEEKSPERVEAFTTGAQELVKELLSKFDEFTFYMGPSGLNEFEDGKCTLVASYYKDEETAPRLIYIKDTFIEEKM
eukprot:GHVP01054736.1.p1 GENE.GHVP01054736.1~~GHVP01054736.1.p1  ORF type:complete len:182 (+),score=50.36 GHVP01054736.1:942-1487(+)